MGCCNFLFLGTGSSLFTSKITGRKPILLVGQIEMMINHAFLSLWSAKGWITAQIIATNAFVLTFNATIGQGMWVYTPEILPSQGMAVVAFVNMVTTAMFGTFTTQFFQILTDVGFYIALAVIQFVCFVFILTCVIETKGKSKHELETLYEDKSKSNPEDNIGKQANTCIAKFYLKYKL